MNFLRDFRGVYVKKFPQFKQLCLPFSFAPWCPACKNLEPIWKDFGSWSDDLSINVAKVDVV